MKKQRTRPHGTPDTSRNNLPTFTASDSFKSHAPAVSQHPTQAQLQFSRLPLKNREIHCLPNIQVPRVLVLSKNRSKERVPVHFSIEQKKFNFHEQ